MYEIQKRVWDKWDKWDELPISPPPKTGLVLMGKHCLLNG